MNGTADIDVLSETLIQRGKTALNNLRQACENPAEYSRDLLLRLMNDNKDTEYGKKCNFSSVKSEKDFRETVPFTTFDDYAEYVVREIAGEKNLHSVYGVKQYNKSSGTMGNPKKIPMSPVSMDQVIAYASDHKYGLVAEQFGDEAIRGKTLSVVEASSISEVADKRYVGVSAQMVLELVEIYGGLFTSPIEATIPDPETNSRYLHARYGIAEEDVTCVFTTFMTFILDFFHYVENNWELLCDDIEKGTIDPSIRMPDEVRKKLEFELEPMPERADALRAIFRQEFGPETAKKIWPNLTYIAGVSTGTFTAYLENLRKSYIGDVPVYMIGITASEGAFTVPYALNNPNFIPVINGIYFEFLPLGEEDPSKTKTVTEVEEGKEYELIVTTFSGLYRYRTRDAIRVTGFYGKVPTLEYLYRIDMCVNLNGEKTYEPALREAVNSSAKEIGFEYTDFCVYPNTDVVPSCYTFYIEMTKIPENMTLKSVSKSLQKNLIRVNPVLEYKFERNLCGPVQTHVLQEETYLLYRDKLILQGGASTQVKPVKIITNEAQLRFFNVLRDTDIPEE